MPMITTFTDDALGEDDAVGVARSIATGRVSRSEVLEAAIARTDIVQQHISAMACRAPHIARATPPTPSGFFAGVPTVIKDMVRIKDMPTTQGSDAWTADPAARDGAFIRSFRRVGVTPIGVSTMSEFGISAVAEHPRLGPVRNPWNTEYSAGGSSSGSAALVAAGALPLAHAVDGGGSIRIPASSCGLVGLKPTRGRLPLDTDLRFIPVQIATNGVLTRTVRDTAAFYREMERVHRSRRLPPIGDITGPARQRLKIAVSTTSPLGAADPVVRAETARVATLLENAGHTVIELDQSPVTQAVADDFIAYYSFVAWSVVHLGRRRFGPTFDPRMVDALTEGLARQAATQMRALPGVVRRLRRAHLIADELWSRCDVLLCPTTAHPTPKVGALSPSGPDFDTVFSRVAQWASFTPFQNVTGEPAISLPTGTTPEGIPIGTQFCAAQGAEATLLALAYEIEEINPWKRIPSNTQHPSDRTPTPEVAP